MGRKTSSGSLLQRSGWWLMKIVKQLRERAPTAPPEQINWLDSSTHRMFLTERIQRKNLKLYKSHQVISELLRPAVGQLSNSQINRIQLRGFLSFMRAYHLQATYKIAAITPIQGINTYRTAIFSGISIPVG